WNGCATPATARCCATRSTGCEKRRAARTTFFRPSSLRSKRVPPWARSPTFFAKFSGNIAPAEWFFCQLILDCAAAAKGVTVSVAHVLLAPPDLRDATERRGEDGAMTKSDLIDVL